MCVNKSRTWGAWKVPVQAYAGQFESDLVRSKPGLVCVNTSRTWGDDEYHPVCPCCASVWLPHNQQGQAKHQGSPLQGGVKDSGQVRTHLWG
jgi:hypothetical protein